MKLNEVEPIMETEKQFPEKDLDQCIDYCKSLNEHLKDLLYPTK